MNDQTDSHLLRAYAEHRSEPAFAELVRRHVDFVYSAARRMVGDSHLAQDVTQGVFLALAKNAVQLTDRPVLSGWLHRTAQNIAAQTVRSDVRRRAREQEAAAMNELLSAETDAAWEHIAPQLDAALGELSEPDRDALLLRYFERKSAHEMAQTLGVSDEAAQKRVSRAVERLREFFAKRGVSVGAGGLVVVISANAVQAAPAGLAVTISTAVALAGTTIATTTAATATAAKAIAMTALQKTLVTALVMVLAGVGIYEAGQASRGRAQDQKFQQERAPTPEPVMTRPEPLDASTPAPFMPTPVGLKGVVLLRGTPPAESVVALDPLCGALHSGPVTTRNYVVGANGALADVLVYVKDGAPSNFTVGMPPVLLDNTNCLFEPYVFAVLTNQPIVIRNSDAALFHNAHSLPAVNAGFNVPLLNGSTFSTFTSRFSRPEQFVTIKCDVHPWMYAYVCVLSHPWFAVTDANGQFQFPLALPPGAYTLAAVHRKAGEVTQTLVVTDGQTNDPVRFQLDAK